MNFSKPFQQSRIPYPSKFSHSPENIIDMSKTIKTSCVSLNKAVYFLVSIPLFSEQLFEYYYLLPIPFKQESKILSMIPEHKILLKGKNITYSTNKHCISGNQFQCYRSDLETSSPCEQKLLSLKFNQCIFKELRISNHVEFIPMLNAYLLSLFKPTVIHVQGLHEEILDFVSGTLL
uniref:Uncharacterized protein n=1 Tax=Cacopsylla melanoneura TaxID=428564 RepID=A0A8D9A414_9HEMI